MASSKIVAGYWRSSEFNSVPPCNIKFSLFTHLFYSFVEVDPSYKLKFTDDDKRESKAFLDAARDNSVKPILSIGGDPSVFAKLAADSAYRNAFIQSTIDVALAYGFDGLDLDWEFPNNKEDMDNLGKLVKEWRIAIKPPLLLTAAVWFNSSTVSGQPYPVADMADALDWINVMAYNLPGSKDTSATMLHAALYDPTGKRNSVAAGVEAWTVAGMPKEKIVLGIPRFAMTWLLEDPLQHGVGAKAKGFGPEPVPPGVSYLEVKQFNRDNCATVEHDHDWVETYSYADTIWLGYDDDWAVKRKVEYASTLAGYFFWAIDQDDAFYVNPTA